MLNAMSREPGKAGAMEKISDCIEWKQEVTEDWNWEVVIMLVGYWWVVTLAKAVSAAWLQWKIAML